MIDGQTAPIKPGLKVVLRRMGFGYVWSNVQRRMREVTLIDCIAFGFGRVDLVMQNVCTPSNTRSTQLEPTCQRRTTCSDPGLNWGCCVRFPTEVRNV